PGLSRDGAKTRAPATLNDLYPTLCELAGLPVPPQCDGLSLVPQLRDPAAPRARPSLTSYVFRGDAGPSHAVADSRHRLIRYADGFEELYDLVNDPHEFTNRAADPSLADVKARLALSLPAQSAVSVGAPAQSSYNLRKTPGKKAKSAK
ncbi:MAG: sulfatase/phosphatase domain-containing protein, partial [Opitutaceae bacterium]